jgi:electron transfer flavoprotein beta subunit
MMKIIVAVKQILDPLGVTVRRDKERVFVNREEYIIDPGSKAALEAALRVKDVSPCEVIAISMGPPRADDALREALAMGCDAAYLLSDPVFEQADIAATARVLAAAVDKLGGADLILAGREAGDSGAGQTGPRLAELLDYAQVCDVYVLSYEPGRILVKRRWGDEYTTLATSLPAVVTVAAEAFRPRYPHGARIINAYRQWQVPVWDANELGLEEDDLKPVITFRGEGFPPPLPVGEIFRGDPERAAQEIVMTLKLQKLIGNGVDGRNSSGSR